jgi:hypothetical protein
LKITTFAVIFSWQYPRWPRRWPRWDLGRDGDRGGDHDEVRDEVGDDRDDHDKVRDDDEAAVAAVGDADSELNVARAEVHIRKGDDRAGVHVGGDGDPCYKDKLFE